MTPELAAFSDWTLALLPRLFLYPGGLWLLVTLLLLRATSGGLSSISSRSLLTDLANARLLAIAVAWVAVALSPLPGTSPLSFPADSLVLAALPIIALLFDITSINGRTISIAGAITIALIVPALTTGALLAPPDGLTIPGIASMLAIIVGLLALSWKDLADLASQVRWLAWLCLGLVPLWNVIPEGSVWGVSLVTALALLALSTLPNWLARVGGLRNRSPRIYPPGETPPGTTSVPDFLVASAWLLALVALLVALPASL